MDNLADKLQKVINDQYFCFNYEEMKIVHKALKTLAEYENAEKQGLLLRLPCTVGTSYWTFDSQYWIEEEKCKGCEHYFGCDTETFCDADEYYPKCTQIVKKVFLNNLEIVSLMNRFGKTVFLTKEEAEQALAEMKGV